MEWLSRVIQVLGIVYVVKLSTSLLIQMHAGLSAYIYPLVFNTEDFRTKYGEWALVTGCTQGIGREYALGLAARGMDVCLVGRNQKRLKEVQKEIEALHNVRTKVIVADFTDVKGVQVVVKQVNDFEIDLGILGTGHSSIKFCQSFKLRKI
jgi:17beta-estradiol 17-dehydrogenase / very-long-chain 3-oxoacyl-CoA reductase